MAPVFSAAGTGVNTFTSGGACSPLAPATVNAGDILICFAFFGAATTTPTTPSGYTLLDGPRSLNTPATNGRVWVFGKIADGSEDSQAAALGSQAVITPRNGIVYRFTGARQGDSIDNTVVGFNFDGPASNATINDVGVTTWEDDGLAVNLIAVADDNAVVSFTGETGGDWTEAVAEFTGTLGTPDTCLQLQTATMASAGTVNGGSQTMAAADPWGVVGFYIRGTPTPPTDRPYQVAAYVIKSAASDQVATVTPNFTPADGEIIVVKATSTHGDGGDWPTPTGGSLTYTRQQNVGNVASHARGALWTAPVGTSPGSMAVSLGSPGAVNNWHSMVVERWTQAQLDATPASVLTNGTASAPSTTLTTEAASSIVTWLNSDWNSVDPVTRAYDTTSATPVEDGLHWISGNYTGYYAWQYAASAASQTFGLTAPAAQNWSLIGLEVQFQAPAAFVPPPPSLVLSQAVDRSYRY